jgi:hypothetical protein
MKDGADGESQNHLGHNRLKEGLRFTTLRPQIGLLPLHAFFAVYLLIIAHAGIRVVVPIHVREQ